MPLEEVLSRMNQYKELHALLSDNKTRLLIPTASVMGVSGAMTLFQSLLGDVGNDKIGDYVSSLLSSPFVPLDVVKITANKEFVMPKTKGVGSNGEVLQLVGSRNEKITMHFFSNAFFGALRVVLKKIIEYAMDNAIVVYLVDDLLSVTPALIERYNLENRGMLKGTVVGEITLVSIVKTKDFFSAELLSRIGATIAIGVGSKYFPLETKRLIARRASASITDGYSFLVQKAKETLESFGGF